jgi:hypothetical protein
MAKGDDIQERLNECDELCKIISASVTTAIKRRKNNQ